MVEITPDYQYAHSRISHFKNEEQGWDGVDGKPASTKTADNAVSFLLHAQSRSISKPSGVTLSTSGHISVIWKSNDWYASINISESNKARAFFTQRNEKMSNHFVFHTDIFGDELLQKIEEITRGDN